jgi:hypothetical protein
VTFSTGSQPGHGRDVTAVLLGLAAAVAGAFLWALIAYATNHQFSFAAILMGLLVGFGTGVLRPGSKVAPVAGRCCRSRGARSGVSLPSSSSRWAGAESVSAGSSATSAS